MAESATDFSHLLNSKYKLTPTFLKRLGGYEDENLLVECEKGSTKYVLKVVNREDSQREGLTEAVVDVQQFLYSEKLPVPSVVLTKEGERIVKIIAGDGLRKAILLSYIPGLDMQSLHLDRNSYLRICKDAGAFAGKLNSAMKEIIDLPKVLNRHYMGCKLESIGVVRKRLHILNDPKLNRLCKDVIDGVVAFCSGKDYFQVTKGLIHGDLGLNNLLFSDESADLISITGVIDFMDACISAYVFELSSLMASVMHDAVIREFEQPYDAAKISLISYNKYFPLNSTELDILYFATLGRLCVIRVYCGFDIIQREETQNHTTFNLKVVENLMKQMWETGQKKWDEYVISPIK